MVGELFINGKDAFTEFGMFVTDSTISSLMTPAGMKDKIENDSRLKDGRDIKTLGKVSSRDLTLEFYLQGETREKFFANYSKLCAELQGEHLNIETKYIPNTIYKTLYVSCTQFTQWTGGLAKFSLKVVEPNPKDRTK